MAHPDDDLYFMNPGVLNAIAAGSPVTTVVLTAAEGDGRNVDTDAPDRNRTAVDYPGYTRARQTGLRRAYSLMATGRTDGPWRSEAARFADGFLVHRDVLVSHPNVHLIFFDLRKSDTLTGYNGPVFSLVRLFDGTAPAQQTLPVPGSPVTEVQNANRTQVVDSLAGILREYRPSVLRTLDPDPEHDAGKAQYTVSDHTDHTAVALLTREAVSRVATDKKTLRPVVEHYRAYANRFWPYNLGKDMHTEKARVLAVYAGANGETCRGNDCGDHQLGTDPYRSTHIFSTAERYAPDTSWLVRDAKGQLLAAAVLGDVAVYWTQDGPGKDHWTGPTALPGNGLTPRLAAAAGSDGRVHLVGLRRTSGADGTPKVDLVRAVQPAPGEPFGAWESLGNPQGSGSEPRRQREAGVPTVAVDGKGYAHVFVRNFGQGLSMRAESADGWGPWTDLGGTFLQDLPKAVTVADGTVEVNVPDKKGVRRWYQQSPQGPLVHDDKPRGLPVASAGFNAVPVGQGVGLYYRQGETAEPLVFRNSGGTRGDLSLFKPGGPTGLGPVGALWRESHGGPDTLMLVRDAAGTLFVAATDNVGAPQWRRLAGPITRAPAMALDSRGRTVIAAIGVDGQLHITRQDDENPQGEFTVWVTV
ncbi:PIG-L family deacetylase [Yinghuangia sp. YIM S09857]|uniref:PIG-L family deacetylase n=1 Tax=Yinghuangia sp. YIM S09857 TaxID=3436929 RepID=UPI003F52C6AA